MRKNELPAAQRSFAQPTACLHVPTELTRDVAKHEARKRRASERHAVGCYKELCRGPCRDNRSPQFLAAKYNTLFLYLAAYTNCD